MMSDTQLNHSSSPDTIVSPEVDYAPKVLEHGQYQYTQVLPLVGTQTVALQASSTTESMFEIPVNLVNLSKSHLTFDLGFRAPAAGGSDANFIHADGLPMIDRLSLYTRSNTYLCDVNNFNYLAKMSMKYTTPMTEFLEKDVAEGGLAACGSGATASSTSNSGIQKCNSKAANSWQGNNLSLTANVSANGAFTSSQQAPVGIPDPAAVFTASTVSTGLVLSTSTLPITATVPVAVIGGYVRSAITNYNALKPQNGNFRPAVDGTYGTVEDIEPRYLINGPSTAGIIGNQDTYVHYDITLGDIADTVFAINKDLVFPEVLILRIQWAGYDKIGFSNTTSVTTPLNGTTPAFIVYNHPAAAYDAAGITGPTLLRPLAAGGPVFNLALYLAMETSDSLRQDLFARRDGPGIKITIPFTYNFKTTNSSSTISSIQQRLNTGHGRRLLKTYFSAFTTGGTLNHAFDNYNMTSQTDDTASKVKEFYTEMNNQRIQQFNMRVAYLTDYMVMKQLLKGSVVTSADVYRANWCFVDDWTGKPLAESKNIGGVDCGIDLTTERLYTVFITSQAEAAYDNYLAFVVQKELSIGRTMVTCN